MEEYWKEVGWDDCLEIIVWCIYPGVEESVETIGHAFSFFLEINGSLNIK